MENKGFWNWMMNLSIVKWFMGLPPCRAVLNTAWGKKLFCKETVSYLFYGVLTTVVDFVVFWAFNKMLSDKLFLTLFGSKHDIGYLIATVISWVVAVLFAFVTNKLFVFESKDLNRRLVVKELGLFTGSRVASLIFSLLWMYLAVTIMTMNEFWAKILGNIVVMIMNYIFSKLFVFRSTKEKEGV